MRIKTISTFFIGLCFTFFIGLHPVYAEDEAVQIDNVTGWEKAVEFATAIVDTEGSHVTNFWVKNIQAPLEVALSVIMPDLLITEPVIVSADLPEYMKHGLAGIVDDQVTAMFNSQPNVDIVAHLAEEWVPGYEESQSVYASGYDDLMSSGVSAIWSKTRDIAYVGFVVILIVIGFMIMFRNKIGGQMMVTVGNSLPKVVIALILVTFSFAIAGLIIDLGGVLTTFLKGLLYGSTDTGIDIYNPLKLFGGFMGHNLKVVAGGLGFSSLIGVILGVIGGIVYTAGTGAIIGGIAILVVALVLAGVVLWGAIKLWIALVKAYFSILVGVAVAPLAMMMGALPGNETAIMNNLKSILRSVLVFPLAYVIVNIPYYLEDQGLTLLFPESLTGNSAAGVGTGLLLQIAKIVAIYAAASTPAMLKGIIPATASKSGADAAAAIKASLSGVPLIGGMFK